MIVRFAIICDSCKRRGEEYEGPFGCCESCGGDLCEGCCNAGAHCCTDPDPCECDNDG